MSFLKEKIAQLLILTLLWPTITSCNKTRSAIEVTCGVCSALAVMPTISFKYVDKISGNNLFYGNSPSYKISQLNVSRLYNGSQQPVIFFADSLNQDFSLGVTPKVNTGDTISIQVANLPIDKLIVKTSKMGVCCPYLITDSVLYNGALVHTAANGPKVITISK